MPNGDPEIASKEQIEVKEQTENDPSCASALQRGDANFPTTLAIATYKLMSIRTIIFDFGNVVGFFSHRKAAEQIARLCDAPPETVLAYLFGNPLEDAYESGRVTTEFILGELRRQFRPHATDEQLSLAFADIFTPNEAVRELVAKLKGRYKLLLLSNTNDLHYRQFQPQFQETLDLMDHLVLSFEVGVRKPLSRIYEICEQRSGSAPAECLFIDDVPANIAGARARLARDPLP